jgi:CheY-like chemotaxis protein
MYSIVIVDDRATNRAIYTQLARSLGQNVSVHAFAAAAEALDWLRTNSADLIVTDCEMPRIDGDEFITRFRAQPGSSRVPIMMITVCGQRQKKLRALESGATDFLRAPVDHYEFIARARNLLKLSQSAVEPVAAAPEERPVADGARALLDRCGERGYAIHVVEIAPAGEVADFSSALRRHLRDGDFVARLDPLRYAVLQTEVAGPADAQALLLRLFGLRERLGVVAALRVGAALPRPGQDAAACLREAIHAMREISPAEVSLDEAAGKGWRLAPLVDLASGALAGAQLLRGFDEAELRDPEALRAALACAARTKDAARAFRVALRLGSGGEGAEAAILRLPSLAGELRIELPPLDLLVPIADMRADAGRMEKMADALRPFGPRWVIDLGAPRDAAAEAADWPALLRALKEGWGDALRVPIPDESGVERARDLRARIKRATGKAPVLRAAGVGSRELLPALRRVGVGRAQGACFGAPFAPRDFPALFSARAGGAHCKIEARRA